MAGKVDVYRIPPNFAEEGTLLSGRVRTRNAVETVLLEGALLYILAALGIGVKARIYLGVVVVIPTAILGLAGIQGESLSVSIWHCLVFLKRRRILGTPTGRDRLEHNRRMRKAKVRERRKGGEKNRKRGRGTPEAAARGRAKREAGAEGRKTEGKRRKARRTGETAAGTEGGERKAPAGV